ncbi:conserved hypothetical 59.0 kDa protein [Desulfarculus baarsii DSM 2075]|uniref:Conserved hypothetical 59.0 kDa protein n=1 Tax=Desulfarculus baarsii (strain ATCC 33931 / DSM 2075 / LMG 7858 / VKM B-1802 / 2st14) TaxID=644282 RepID=E1QJV8_DESB2|nr:radical SAM family RiPP maturation amino acid epimerase [Desulfarculus baarsii]ADK85851.1 conserved hypothetical 59.0 kDa protein [Desulfarculus baarsii DSM 2075]
MAQALARPADDPAQDEPFAFHEQFVRARDATQKKAIAGVKRLLEWIMADQDFRLALRQDPSQAAALAAQRGVPIDPRIVEPIWRDGFKTICPTVDYEKWPHVRLWNEWIRDILRYRDMLCLAADPGERQPRFAQWRQRRIEANNFFLGQRNKAIVYPVFSYELSKGCSVGCWFCAFSAARLSGVCRHDAENARLWRQILEVGLDIFGPGAAQSGFCYWATEPSDNPDYLDFLADFRAVNGVICQTTTAAATRDIAWTRRLLAMYEDEPRSVKPRFSVLSLGMLRRIHQEFSAEELLRVECIPQNAESFLCKARSGRAGEGDQGRWREEWRGRAAESGGQPPADEAELEGYAGTTACVAGYLVNMVERSVRLISPCEASAQWPLGYKVHATGSFASAAGYRDFIRRTIDEHMPESLPTDAPVGLARGLKISEDEDSLAIASRAKVLRVRPRQHIYAQVARLLQDGQQRPEAIMAELMDQGQSPFDVTGALDYFFKMGLLE